MAAKGMSSIRHQQRLPRRLQVSQVYRNGRLLFLTMGGPLCV
jgi:hypothetical protein